MTTPVVFPFRQRDPQSGAGFLAPVMPLTLARGPVALTADGLLDTGATVNVLPYGVGARLGATWDDQPPVGPLAGNLAASEARGLVLTATVGPFPAVRLAFAWVRSDDVPLLLGQVNFFQEFDVCFFRHRHVFEVKPRS